jgi:hypothetical protein
MPEQVQPGASVGPTGAVSRSRQSLRHPHVIGFPIRSTHMVAGGDRQLYGGLRRNKRWAGRAKNAFARGVPAGF